MAAIAKEAGFAISAAEFERRAEVAAKEQLKSFLEAVNADNDLQEKLKAAGDDVDTLVAIAKAAGFSMISAEWLEKAQEAAEVELSDEELEAVTGGILPFVAAFAVFGAPVLAGAAVVAAAVLIANE